MNGFVNFHRVVARRSAFLVFPSAQNGGGLEGQTKSGRLKHQFSQMERYLDLQKNPKLVFIPKKKIQWKKVIVMKNEDEESEKVGKKLGGW
jgi:hypothetical protein